MQPAIQRNLNGQWMHLVAIGNDKSQHIVSKIFYHSTGDCRNHLISKAMQRTGTTALRAQYPCVSFNEQ